MNYSNKRIAFKDLITYGEIYGIQLTATDVKHLESVVKKYSGLESPGLNYNYKQISDAYDLTLILGNKDQEYVNLSFADATARTLGGKILVFGNSKVYINFVMDKTLLMEMVKLFAKVHIQDKVVFNSEIELRKYVFESDNLEDLLGKVDLYTVSSFYSLLGKSKQFDEAGITQTELNKLAKSMPKYAKKILDVIELADDTRIAFYASNNTGYYGAITTDLRGYSITPDAAQYNYTDKGRFFSHYDQDDRYGKLYFTDFDPLLPTDEKALDHFIRGKEFTAIDNQTLDIVVRREARRKQEEQIEKDAQLKLTAKFEERVKELEQNKSFSFNDMTFTQQNITYEGQILQDNNVLTKNILAFFSNQYTEDRLNFDRIYETFVNQVAATALKKESAAGKIGNVDYNIKVTIKKDPVSGEIVSRTIKVNKRRINKDEVGPVLARALCYTSTKDFDQFVESVSRCSLKYHRILAAGINLTVADEILNQTINFKIILDRKKNKNYISIGTAEFKVSNTNKLLTLLNARSMSRVIEVLLDAETVGVTGQDIRHIIEEGKKAYAEQIEREQKLLSQTVDLFGVVREENVSLTNGRNIMTGYVITGKKRRYIIDSSSLNVYEYPTGKYLCMVDKGQNELVNTYRLVGRMYALANDSKLATEITTL